MAHQSSGKQVFPQLPPHLTAILEHEIGGISKIALRGYERKASHLSHCRSVGGDYGPSPLLLIHMLYWLEFRNQIMWFWS